MDGSKKYTVYCYTNKINGKKYVGQTCQTLLERSKTDGSGYKSCTYFWNAIQKYGFNNFNKEIIADKLSKEDADFLEHFYIDLWDLKNHNFGYNLRDGGSHGALTDEHKMKIGEANKNPSIETREKLRQCRLGVRLSEESKKKLSESHKGKKQTKTQVENRVKKLIGQKRTEEQKQNISNALKGKKRSKESIEKIAEKQKKPVLELDKKNNIVRIFDSAKSAAQYYGLHDYNVSKCCRRGNGATTGGIILVYAQDFLKEENINVFKTA